MMGQGTAQDQLFYAFNLDDRLRLRGLSGAQDEFLLAATAQNLRRMAKWLMPIEGHAAVRSV